MTWTVPRTWADEELVTDVMMNAVRDQLNILASQSAHGRLTLTSGTPVTVSDVTAATSVYWTPYKGNLIGLYNTTDSRWEAFAFTERTLSLSGFAANTNFDIFLYNNAGTLTLESVAWTDDTTRATALTTQDSTYVKSGDASRRYLGTIRTTGTTGQCEDSAAKRLVWNYYNRVMRQLLRADPTATWTYNVNALRQARASTDNQVALVCGVREDAVTINYSTIGQGSSVSSNHHISIGINSTVNGGAQWAGYSATTTSSEQRTLVAGLTEFPRLGYSYYAMLERAISATTQTFWGSPYGAMTGLWAA